MPIGLKKTISLIPSVLGSIGALLLAAYSAWLAFLATTSPLPFPVLVDIYVLVATYAGITGAIILVLTIMLYKNMHNQSMLALLIIIVSIFGCNILGIAGGMVAYSTFKPKKDQLKDENKQPETQGANALRRQDSECISPKKVTCL